jgi:hypothetical protein
VGREAGAASGCELRLPAYDDSGALHVVVESSAQYWERRYAMDATLVSAMAGVFGSLVGGSASVATAWITQKTMNKRELIGAEIRQREALYGVSGERG